MTSRRAITACIALALALAGCQQAEPPSQTVRVQEAIVQLAPLEGRSARGILELVPTGGGLQIEGAMTGLRGRTHEYRVHRLGDCTDPFARSAGNPFTFTDPVTGRDVDGKMLATTSDDTGEVRVSGRFSGGRLSGPLSLIGRSIIVHRLDRQPDGSMIDTRIACGVLGIAREGTS